jgi:L-ribulose-5-phosphate 3-epimerase
MPESSATDPTLTRRQALLAGASLAMGASALFQSSAAAAPAPPADPAPAQPSPTRRFPVAADDLFLLQRQKLKAFAIAQKCGLDGVSVDMGGMPEGKELRNELRKPEVRQQFLDESKKTGVAICSLGFFGMYAHVYPDTPIAQAITEEWVDTMEKMNVKLGFLPLMTKGGTMREPEHADLRRRTIKLLKGVAPRAERGGVVLGIESNLDGDGYKRFLDDIGSPAVKAFYNPGVGLENKFDVYQDLRTLGKDRIAALHIEQGAVAPEKFEHLLGEGPIDFRKLKAAVDDIGWSGWLSIARSRKQGRERKVEENFTHNAKFLHTVFSE